MSEIATIEPGGDAALFEQEMKEQLEARFEGIKFAEGAPITWLIKAQARIDATIATQAVGTTTEYLRKFGETIISVPPVAAAPAIITSTWTMIDSAGYTIPSGAQVAVAATGDQSVGFIVIGDVTVAPGDTETAGGEVLLQAIKPGEEGNGLSGDASLVDALAFVQSIALEGVTSGGVDEEEEEAYLVRLKEELQLLSHSLIVSRDFEIDARATPGVARVLCIPAYNGEAEKEEALAVTEIGVDEAGASLAAPVKEDLGTRQEEKLPSGVNLYLADPTHTKVDVFSVVTASTGFDPAAVKSSAGERLAEYLDPSKWGVPGFGDAGNSTGWVNTTKVYFNELISEVDRVPGVDRVVSLLLGSGSGKAFTVTASTDKFSSVAHGFSNGDVVVLRTGLTPGAPLAAGTVYYVRDVEADAFKLTATVGGAAIDITSDGSGTAVKLGTADVTLPGLAPLAEPGEIGVEVE